MLDFLRNGDMPYRLPAEKALRVESYLDFLCLADVAFSSWTIARKLGRGQYSIRTFSFDTAFGEGPCEPDWFDVTSDQSAIVWKAGSCVYNSRGHFVDLATIPLDVKVFGHEVFALDGWDSAAGTPPRVIFGLSDNRPAVVQLSWVLTLESIRCSCQRAIWWYFIAKAMFSGCGIAHLGLKIFLILSMSMLRKRPLCQTTCSLGQHLFVKGLQEGIFCFTT